MIVITTPTGQIGSQLLARLLEGDEPVRVIARDPSRLAPATRERVEVIEGSHDDAATLDRALPGADALFMLVPPNFSAPNAEAHYLAFAGQAAAAIVRHGLSHAVGVSSAGHGWPKPAGLISAAFAADAAIESTGVAYRALSMPFFMENLIRQLGVIGEHGTFYLPAPADRPLATVATRDVAARAAELLSDRSWSGQANELIFGPDQLSPNEMAAVIAEVLGRPAAYSQLGEADFAASLAQSGASESIVDAMVEMVVAQREGVYDADQMTATPYPTDFRTWCEEVLQPLAAR